MHDTSPSFFKPPVLSAVIVYNPAGKDYYLQKQKPLLALSTTYYIFKQKIFIKE